MTAPLLRLDRLRITHESATRATPDGVSLTVNPGEAVLLLGPSGCGKSTLALAAAGLVPRAVDAALEGRVLLGGVDATTLEAGRAAEHVAIVFQDPDAQLVTATVEDEVAFGVENLCLDEAEIARRVTAALDVVGLADRRRDAPESLSGGGRQRLAIAAALALGSPLLVLDEPTANLDPAGARDVYAALAPLVAAGSHGVLLVEHDLDEALRITTRVVALDARGRVIADGPPREVLVERADELADAGVWLPIGAGAARVLARAGVTVPGDPLTAAELVAAIDDPPAASEQAAREPAHESIVDADARSMPRPGPEPSTPPTPPLLRVEGLTVQIGERTLLDRVSLDVEPGAFTAIVGANGAGKTTLLHAIAGVVRPPRRTVQLEGDDVTRLSPRQLRSRVGVVFQNPEHQFLRQRVRDELELGLDARDPAVAARVDELLARFGLTDQAGLHPFLLSGGGKRRLSVGTALAQSAGLLVLDEPTYGQDRTRAEELLSLLEELRRDGTTIVMATHDLQLVAEHASDLVVLDAGRVVARGPVGEVFNDGVLEHIGIGLPPLARALRRARRADLHTIARIDDLAAALAAPTGTVA